MATIYVVEDDENIAEIESFALKNSGYHVEVQGNAGDFYEALNRKKPDVILLDIMLPDEDGMDILKKLKNRVDTKKIPVMMVTAKGTEIDKVRGLDGGADDYITKPFGIMELIARVKALLRRNGESDSIEYSVGNIIIKDDKRKVSVNGEKIELTYKEYELLKLLVKNQGNVLPRDMILEKVWGIDYEGESRTLDMHVKTLRQKLGDAGSLIQTVRNVGYVISE